MLEKYHIRYSENSKMYIVEKIHIHYTIGIFRGNRYIKSQNYFTSLQNAYHFIIIDLLGHNDRLKVNI